MTTTAAHPYFSFKERQILEYLQKNTGRFVKAMEIALYCNPEAIPADARSITIHVYRLRQKGVKIQTAVRVGIRLEAEHEHICAICGKVN